MEFSPDLVADLAGLTSALGRPDTHLQAVLDELGDKVLAAVPSFAGLSVAVSTGGDRFTASAVVRPGSVEPVLASVRLTLAEPSGAGEPGKPGKVTIIVLYAHAAGALVDLAADISWALDMTSDVLSIDDGSAQEMPRPGSSGLHDLSAVHRGIGILLDQGLDPGSADAELTRLSQVAGTSRPAAAADLVRRAAERRR